MVMNKVTLQCVADCAPISDWAVMQIPAMLTRVVPVTHSAFLRGPVARALAKYWGIWSQKPLR